MPEFEWGCIGYQFQDHQLPSPVDPTSSQFRQLTKGLLANTHRLTKEQLAEFEPIDEVHYSCIESEYTEIEINERYQKRMPHHVQATSRKCHLGVGEVTSLYSDLAKVIRDRGLPQDDAGHVLAASLGGKMVDFNLFPQLLKTNRGWEGTYMIWRVFEVAAVAWLALIPEKFNPRVISNVWFMYESATNKPHRPTMYPFTRRFIIDDDENEDAAARTEKQFTRWVCNLHVMAVTAMKTGKLMSRKYVMSELPSGVSEARRKELEELFWDEYEEIMAEFKSGVVKAPDLTTYFRDQGNYGFDRPLSVWDFVPVVGSVKQLTDGFEDFQHNCPGAGTFNMAMGGVSLAADVFTLGLASSTWNMLMKGGSKVAAKEGVKTAAKTGGKAIGRMVLNKSVYAAIKLTVKAGAVSAELYCVRLAARLATRGFVNRS